MSAKTLVFLGMTIGSVIGGYIPTLWGAGIFSYSSVLFSGLGAILGGLFAGKVVDHFTDATGLKNWQNIWFSFAAYALAIAVLFLLLFKYKHDPNAIKNVHTEPLLPPE